MKTQRAFEKMVDLVLRYRPEAKIKEPRERKKKPKVEADENKIIRESKG